MQRKTFDKIQYPFLVKTSRKLKIEGKFLSQVKSIYEEATSNIILKSETLSYCPLKLGRVRMSVLTTSTEHFTRSCTQYSEGGKRSKSIYTGKEKVKLSLFIDDILVYVEYSLQLCYSKKLKIIQMLTGE